MADAYGFNGDKSKFELDKLIGDDTMIEESPATANHAIGDYIVYESQLYKVTAAIATGEDLEIGTNITLTSVSSELGTIQDSLTKTKISIEQGITSSTSLVYTGVSFTIPANYIYGASISAAFINNGPLEVVVSRSSDPSNTNSYIARCTSASLGNGSCLCNITGLLSEQATYYVHAKYNAVGANRIDVKGWYMPL